MDCCARFKAVLPLSEALPVEVRPRGRRLRPRWEFRRKIGSLGSFRPSLDFQGIAKFQHGCNLSCARSQSLITLASAESGEFESRSVVTPLESQSSEGKFLCGILKNQPHIFLVAAAEQLEELATNRDSAFARWEHSAGSSESCLHGRIAEMRERECQIAVEEIMYLLIVHNFSKIKVPMVPNLSRCIGNGRIEIFSSKELELESVHGPDVLEMVREHLSNILIWKRKSNNGANWSAFEFKRLHLGQIYAASIMYGYFLKSVSLRHHLELSLAMASDEDMAHLHFPRFQKQEQESLIALGCSAEKGSNLLPIPDRGGKANRLRGYMMDFDSKTLQLCAKLRSAEAVNLIENHCYALFGNPEKQTDSYDNDEVIAVSDSGLKRLLLEAVAFGSFLWDVEEYVDSVYKLKEN